MLEEDNGFSWAISRPSFIAPDEVVFAATGPYNGDLRQAVIELGLYGGYLADQVAYSMRFGELPQVRPESRHGRPAGNLPGNHPLAQFSASQGGRRFVFVNLSDVEPQTKGVGYNYEIFLSENGRIEQVTNIKSFMASINISYDGRTVAFLANDNRTVDFDLFLLDLETREVRATGLRDRLRARVNQPDFKM